MNPLIRSSMFFHRRPGDGASFAASRRTVRYILVFVLMLGFTHIGKAQFQQNQRINSLTIESITDTFAVQNLIGQAFTSFSLAELQPALNAQISSGQSSMILEMPGLTDLSGTNQASLQIGAVNGAPVINAGNPTTYSGSSDLDWWYTQNANELDVSGAPADQLPASISTSVLSAGPGYLTLRPSPLSDSGGYLTMSNARMIADVGSSSKPLISGNGFPPGHLPSENIDTALVSFGSMSGGRLKGNISASSLAHARILYSLTAVSDQGYTASNSLLDLIVGGATMEAGLIVLVNPSNPDQVDPNAPVVGAGPPYEFLVGAGKKVDRARDKNLNLVNLDSVLNAAAYSAYFTFTTDRVIVPISKTLSLGISSSWNLISVPLIVRNPAAHVLFPTAISKAFAYNNTYLQEDTLRNGVGYWLKFPGSVADSISGVPLNTDTIPLVAGWNLVGSISSPVAVTSVQSIPPGMITSRFFGYLGTYAVIDTIQPGRGYWVKVNGSGSLVLNAASSASAMRPGIAGRIHILPTAELPPSPPEAASGSLPLPTSFALEQNFPNPFNPTTVIDYTLPERALVSMKVYNVLGEEIATLVNGSEDAGFKSVEFDASALSSGVYFYRIDAGTYHEIRKMTVLR